VVEIDIYDASGFPVKHDPGEADTANNCKGGAGGLLQDCLRDIKAWSDAHPGHCDHGAVRPQAHHRPVRLGASLHVRLNNLVISEFGAKAYKPEDLRSFTGYASLREGVFRAGWPSVDSLRGRIIVQMMGGPIGDKNDTQEEYVNQFGAAAQIFVCPRRMSRPTSHGTQRCRFRRREHQTNGWSAATTRRCSTGTRTRWTAQQNGQLVNLWSSNETQFDAFQQMYLAVAWGASMISHESLEDLGRQAAAERPPPLGRRRRLAAQRLQRLLRRDPERSLRQRLGPQPAQLQRRGAAAMGLQRRDPAALGRQLRLLLRHRGRQRQQWRQAPHLDLRRRSSEKWQLQTDGRLIGMNGRCADVVDNTVGTRLQIRNCSGAASQRSTSSPARTPTTRISEPGGGMAAPAGGRRKPRGQGRSRSCPFRFGLSLWPPSASTGPAAMPGHDRDPPPMPAPGLTAPSLQADDLACLRGGRLVFAGLSFRLAAGRGAGA